MAEEKNKRPIDEVAKESYSSWGESLVLISKTKIKTWQAVFIFAFIVGGIAALIWTYSNDSMSASNAASLVAGAPILGLAPSKCIDSDNGMDYYKAGTTTGIEAPGGNNTGTLVTYPDRCEASKYLSEYYCDQNNQLYWTTFACPNGCSNGACIASSTASVSGVCIVRDSYTSSPKYNDPDVGKGYAKIKITGAKDYNDLKAKCVSSTYDTLLKTYCANGKNSLNKVQRQATSYDSVGNPLTTGCGPLGCDLVGCPVAATIQGVCIVRNDYTSVPKYNDPDIGKGYAKIKIAGAKDYNDLKTKCTGAIYETLLKSYCAYGQNSANKVQRGVTTFNLDGSALTSGCSSLGCNLVSCAAPAPTCKDSDGGRNYAVKGTMVNGTKAPQTDFCFNTKSLNEYYCNNGAATGEMYACPNGCKDGACAPTPIVKCNDSDGGINYYVKGTISGIEGPGGNNSGKLVKYDDNCTTPSYLNEYYCGSDNLVHWSSYLCPSKKCLSGVCTRSPIVIPR